MGKQVHDLGQNGRHSLVVDELANGIESSASDKVIVRLEILLDGVDDQDDQIVIVAEEERNGEVTGAFEQEIVVMGHPDGVDVGEGAIIAEHFDVDEADDVLLHLALGDFGLGET
ncbi:hypothetical protein Pyn_14735 [Prunus yedoensis var. nudiflora]|uniref:Uncharacterized protein n=1 Tax=Prunus yedoensis var. nudiflora TaxID=2094558 RepID=A0A314UN17_PRUYE|nr:hypothetical protein Pyn_14735 [Prunus yedoensis var. nudiflora]